MRADRVRDRDPQAPVTLANVSVTGVGCPHSSAVPILLRPASALLDGRRRPFPRARLCLAPPQIVAQRLRQPGLFFGVVHRAWHKPRDGGLTIIRAPHIGAPPLATAGVCCRSSVVERILGKAEVVSSILTGSTIFS